MNKDIWQLPNFRIHQFRKKRTKYCICIPVLNEGDRIKNQLKKMLPYSKLADIIVADWGSTDGSMEKNFLKKCNIRTLLVLESPGRQGTQLRMGFSYALTQGYEGIIQVDGNDKDGVDAIPKFLKALDEGFDYIQGSRFIKGGKAENTPPLRYLAIRFLASPILSMGSGFWYTDVTNGFRGYSKKYLLHPNVKPFRKVFKKYDLNMYLTVRANQIGLRTKEIPVTRRYVRGSVSTKISFLKGNLDFFTTIVKAALGLYNP